MESLVYCYSSKEEDSLFWQLFLITDEEEDKILRVTTQRIEFINRSNIPFNKCFLSDNFTKNLFDQYTIAQIDLVDDISFDCPPPKDWIIDGHYNFSNRLLKEILNEILYTINYLNYSDEFIEQVKSLILKTNIYHEQDSFKKT